MIVVETLQNANLVFTFTEYHNVAIFISVKLDWFIEITPGLGFFCSYNYYNINFFFCKQLVASLDKRTYHDQN